MGRIEGLLGTDKQHRRRPFDDTTYTSFPWNQLGRISGLDGEATAQSEGVIDIWPI